MLPMTLSTEFLVHWLTNLAFIRDCLEFYSLALFFDLNDLFTCWLRDYKFLIIYCVLLYSYTLLSFSSNFVFLRILDMYFLIPFLILVLV